VVEKNNITICSKYEKGNIDKNQGRPVEKVGCGV